MNAKKELSVEEAHFMMSVEGSITLPEDNHNEISLPMRKAKLTMPYNKPQAEQRASYLKRRLQKDPKLLEDYRIFMNDMISKGYAEEVSDTKKN